MPCNHTGEYQTCDTLHECVGCGESLMGFFTKGYCLSCWHIASTARANAIEEAINLVDSKTAEWEKLGDYGTKPEYAHRIEGANEIAAALQALRE